MPDIITRALLENKGIPTRDIVAAIWGRKLSGGYEPAEVTGTLPLTFRSNGTVLLDYRIYGNTVETANLVPLTTQKTATGSGITVTIDSSGVWHVTGTATSNATILFDLEEAFTVPTALDNGGEGVIQFFNSVAMDDGSGSETARVLFYYGNFQRDYMGLHIQNRSITQYSGLANMSINRLGIWVKQGITCDFTLSPMVVDDGIVHNEYISPETTEVQGVGARTENLFDPNAAETSGNNIISDFMPLDTSEQVLTMAFDIPLRASYNYEITYYDSTKTAISFVGGMGEAYKTRETVKFNRQSEAPNAAYVKFTLPKDLTNVLIQNGSTSGEYIPYGYKLPMVSRTENAPYHRTATPIYIGNTQLMQDEYVSYSEGKVYKYHGELTLKGDETNIYYYGIFDGVKTFYIDIPNNSEVVSGSQAYLSCNYYSKTSSIYPAIDKTCRYQSLSNNIWNIGRVYIMDNDYTDLSSFTTHLSELYDAGKPLKIWYTLKNAPIVTGPPVPLPKLPTFSDTNTVLDYEQTPAPEEVWVKYKKGD